jgi:hypothetical protein
MYDLHKYIDTWDSQKLFLYVVVFVLVLWYFLKKDIGVNLLIALIVGGFIISYLNTRSINAADTADEIQKIKLTDIKPTVSKNSSKQKNIIDFLFSIQDLYVYNPLQYEHIIEYINEFYEQYDKAFIDPTTSAEVYGFIKQSKRDAINALKSMIFSIPDNQIIRNKINTASITLDTIMSDHLDQISYLIDEQIYIHGYNVNTKIIDYGPKPYNEYSDMYGSYTYEVV